VKEKLYILNGVRRALATREAGRRTIWALFDKPIEVEALGLSEQSPAVPLSKVKLT
jgi:hypothetical protein